MLYRNIKSLFIRSKWFIEIENRNELNKGICDYIMQIYTCLQYEKKHTM